MTAPSRTVGPTPALDAARGTVLRELFTDVLPATSRVRQWLTDCRMPDLAAGGEGVAVGDTVVTAPDFGLVVPATLLPAPIVAPTPVITDIIETATLRYFVDQMGLSGSTLVLPATTLPPGGTHPQFDAVGSGFSDVGGTLFGKRCLTGESASYEVSGMGGVTAMTMAVIYGLDSGARSGGIESLSYAGYGLNAPTSTFAVGCGAWVDSFANTKFSDIYVGGDSIIQRFEYGTSAAYVVFCYRFKRTTGISIQYDFYHNNTNMNGTVSRVGITSGKLFIRSPYISPGKFGRFRDMAIWFEYMSDTDFAALNSQLCAEYGIP